MHRLALPLTIPFFPCPFPSPPQSFELSQRKKEKKRRPDFFFRDSYHRKKDKDLMASSSSDGVTARPTSAVTNIQSWDEFTEHFVISDSKLVVLVFMAPWSEPWKLMRPVVETMARQLRSSASGEVCALSVDRFNTLGRLLRVEALPTFVLVKKRRAVGRVVGVNREELQASVNKHLAPASSAQSIVDIAAAT